MIENETKQIKVETEPKSQSESPIKQDEKIKASSQDSIELVKLLNSLTDKTAYTNNFVSKGKTIIYNFIFCDLPEVLQKRTFFNTPIKIIGNKNEVIGVVTSSGINTVNFRLLTKLDIIISRFE